MTPRYHDITVRTNESVTVHRYEGPDGGPWTYLGVVSETHTASPAVTLPDVAMPDPLAGMEQFSGSADMRAPGLMTPGDLRQPPEGSP